VRLREAVQGYLAAVDEWDAAYQKYYRLPGFGARVSGDLEAEQRVYDTRRRELEAMVPRARRLCLKYELKEPFSGLLRISLGRYAPQQRMDPTIGRSERGAVAQCLVELQDACGEWATPPGEAEPKQSLLRRLLDYLG